MTVIRMCMTEHSTTSGNRMTQSKYMHSYMHNTGKSTMYSLSGWRSQVTHSLCGYCTRVHHTMCSAQNVDWVGMYRWKQSLCLHWHVLAHCCRHGIEGACPHDEWLEHRNCKSGNVTNNVFWHMQQPFHQGGRVIMHAWFNLQLGFTERT